MNGRRSPSRAGKDDDSETSSAAEAGGGSEGGRLVGRKILKRWGDTVISGYVKDYNPPVDGKQESWTLRHEKNFDGGDVEGDNSVGEDEEVDRPELDKRLNLQAVMEREFPSSAKKKGRGRPRKDATPVYTPPRKGKKFGSKKSPGRKPPRGAVVTPSKKTGSGGGGGSAKRRAVSPAPSAASSVSSGPTPRKKRKKTKAKGQDGDSRTLKGNEEDLGVRVAKEFTPGVFTGEVVEIKPSGFTGLKGTLWKIDYEDGDREDLNEAEMKGCMHTYKYLKDRFEATKGGKVTAEDLANEDLHDEDVKAVSSESQSSTNGGGKGTPKRKGKGKVKAARLDACEKLVGAGVRKYFPRYDEEFDGEVSSYLPPESDDEHGDLWLIKYEDGDNEHFEPDELAEARALYNKRHALAKKVVTFPTKALFGGQAVTNLSLRKINVFGETPVGPRGVFCTIRGYRRSKSKGKS